ncbi:MAG: hypothetical protein M1837_003954 [Sclerophora amabilis]|nr:MAG: hypothetical protein M1837_003954 [Sclerophora amabilis]
MELSDKLSEKYNDPSNAVGENAQVLSIFPHGAQHAQPSTTELKPLQWYGRWLDQQFKTLPPSIIKRLRSESAIFLEVASSATVGCSIDDIATKLLHLELIQEQDGDSGRDVAIAIVFAVLGWQTMLYEPALGTCPPQQLAIADVLDGYAGQAFMTLKQNQSRIKRSLPDFLLGFGLMLPRENLCISEDPDDCQSFEKVTIISPGEMNAALIQSLARINIKWIDVMAPHLEFDKATNTLFLFRYPSFCMANIPLQGDVGMSGVVHG